jgi:GNAT superfamily N-acetyltransferase
MRKKIQGPAYAFIFLVRNLSSAKKIKPVQAESKDGFVYRGLKPEDMTSFLSLYSILHNGKKLNLSRKLLYHFAGEKLVIVACKESTLKMTGMDMYYFNKQDVNENTVHQGFTGILPEMQGKGLGTRLRLKAKEHFYQNGFSGISSKVSLLNIASLKSNEKLGFKPVEKYYDKSLEEERYYLVCNFEESLKNGTLNNG